MHTETLDINGTSAYVVRPEGTLKGGLIVIHEIWGLDDHVKDVAARFAAEGYFVVAPDLLTGTVAEMSPTVMIRLANPETRDEAQKEMRAALAPINSPEFGEMTTKKLQGIYTWLKEQPQTNGTIASIGYCFGGTYSFALATVEPSLTAAISYYGHATEDEEKLSHIACPVLAFNGTEDTRLMDELPALITNMEKAGVAFTHVEYENTGHAFFNDRNTTMYREDAAKDSWVKTLAFLQENGL